MPDRPLRMASGCAFCSDEKAIRSAAVFQKHLACNSSRHPTTLTSNKQSGDIVHFDGDDDILLTMTSIVAATSI